MVRDRTPGGRGEGPWPEVRVRVSAQSANSYLSWLGGGPLPPQESVRGGGRQGPPGHVVVEIRVRPCRRPAAPSMDASSPALPSPSPPSPSAPPLPPPPPTFLAEAAVDPNGQCVFLCIIASQIQPMIYYQGGP